MRKRLAHSDEKRYVGNDCDVYVLVILGWYTFAELTDIVKKQQYLIEKLQKQLDTISGRLDGYDVWSC